MWVGVRVVGGGDIIPNLTVRKGCILEINHVEINKEYRRSKIMNLNATLSSLSANGNAEGYVR